MTLKMQLDVGNEPYMSKQNMIPCPFADMNVVSISAWLTTHLKTFRQPFILCDGQTDRRTESDTYEPIVQYAQVG